MPVWISMLRGVNLGSHKRIKMDALRALYQSLKLEDVRTYVVSGNVVFRAKASNAAALTKTIEDAIERTFGFRTRVILRSPAEFRQAIAANPFAGRPGLEPGKLLVTFLLQEPGVEARNAIAGLRKKYPEEPHLVGRELYIYFPHGAGKSKLPWSSVEKLVKTTGTARNWNSVMKMLQIAEELEGDA